MQSLFTHASTIIVSPVVYFSVVDHYFRMINLGSRKRVVGILLGSWRSKNVLDISNSFAVPFDDDETNKNVWFLDHGYLENMYSMLKKMNACEKIMGWYHTGPKLHQNDIAINELIRTYCPTSVLVIIVVEPIDHITEAYIAVDEVHEDGTPTTKTFEHVLSQIGAGEAEEVDVEHLIRKINHNAASRTILQKITNQLLWLKGLHSQLRDIENYRHQIVREQYLVNNHIIYLRQHLYNLCPDLNNLEFNRSLHVHTNDHMLSIYLAFFIRAVIGLHYLINNKLSNRDAERKENSKKEDTRIELKLKVKPFFLSKLIEDMKEGNKRNNL